MHGAFSKSTEKKLNNLRVDNHLTIRAVAQALGVSEGTAGCWFSNIYPVAEQHVEGLATLLGVDAQTIRECSMEKPKKSSKLKNRPGALSKTDTFWAKKRLEAELSIEDVAEAVGAKRSTIGNSFLGVFVPSDELIRKLCDLFDVDFEEGKAEFIKAHNEKHSKKLQKPLVDITEVPTVTESEKQAEASVNVEPEDTPSVSPVNLGSDLLQLIYGKLPYAEFMEIVVITKGGYAKDPLQTLYGRVDFDTFNKIAEVLKGGVPDPHKMLPGYL